MKKCETENGTGNVKIVKNWDGPISSCPVGRLRGVMKRPEGGKGDKARRGEG